MTQNKKSKKPKKKRRSLIPGRRQQREQNLGGKINAYRTATYVSAALELTLRMRGSDPTRVPYENTRYDSDPSNAVLLRFGFFMEPQEGTAALHRWKSVEK